MANEQVKSITRREQLASAGLRLPALTLQRLKERGIFCVSTLSVVLQHSTQRYVIRAHESGGAVADLGAFCGFVSEDGQPLAWLQRVETIGVNGLHSRVIATSIVRVHIVRVVHTYELLITRHSLPTSTNGRKPSLVNSILFHGRQGTLELELWGKDAALRGRICPIFYDRGGDALEIPAPFEDAVQRAVAGVTCCGCEHSHLLVPPEVSVEPGDSTNAEQATREAVTEPA